MALIFIFNNCECHLNELAILTETVTELKTKKNTTSVEAFIRRVENQKRREDSFIVLELMTKITQVEPDMWGTSIVGFGTYHYKYASGKDNDWFLTGFSPGKQRLTIYIMNGLNRYDKILSRLGKYKTGKSCLYINKLEDINMPVLEELISASVDHLTSKK